MNSRNNLTEGPIFGQLIRFAIPVILGNLCFQLYNVVDSIVVGNYVGTDALANRHGLITGASGSGKTITLKVMAESFSEAGIPVFMADVKGDLAGTCAFRCSK